MCQVLAKSLKIKWWRKEDTAIFLGQGYAVDAPNINQIIITQINTSVSIISVIHGRATNYECGWQAVWPNLGGGNQIPQISWEGAIWTDVWRINGSWIGMGKANQNFSKQWYSLCKVLWHIGTSRNQKRSVGIEFRNQRRMQSKINLERKVRDRNTKVQFFSVVVIGGGGGGGGGVYVYLQCACWLKTFHCQYLLLPWILSRFTFSRIHYEDMLRGMRLP